MARLSGDCPLGSARRAAAAPQPGPGHYRWREELEKSRKEAPSATWMRGGKFLKFVIIILALVGIRHACGLIQEGEPTLPDELLINGATQVNFANCFQAPPLRGPLTGRRPQDSARRGVVCVPVCEMQACDRAARRERGEGNKL